MFFFAHFKRNYGFARPGDVFWVDDKAASQIPKHVLFEMLPSTRLMRVDPHTGDKNFLIVRSGGIGDILALSDIARSATKVGMKVMMVTQKKMFPVVRWWSEQPASLKHFDQPLWNVKRQKLTDFLSDWGMMHGEDEIEKGGDRNWFQVFADASGFPCTGRPQLRDIRLSIGVRNKCWGDMIIVTRSTSVMRTAPRRCLLKYRNGGTPSKRWGVYGLTLTMHPRRNICACCMMLKWLCRWIRPQFISGKGWGKKLWGFIRHSVRIAEQNITPTHGVLM